MSLAHLPICYHRCGDVARNEHRRFHAGIREIELCPAHIFVRFDQPDGLKPEADDQNAADQMKFLEKDDQTKPVVQKQAERTENTAVQQKQTEQTNAAVQQKQADQQQTKTAPIQQQQKPEVAKKQTNQKQAKAAAKDHPRGIFEEIRGWTVGNRQRLMRERCAACCMQ